MVKKRILACDGGGIRGKATAQFLKRLEAELKNPLHTYFDFYAGTSTGSFIIAGLAYEKMTCGEIADTVYSVANAKTIMPHSLADDFLGLIQTQPKYNGKGKREVIDRYMEDRLLDDTDKHVLVCGYDIVKDKPLFYKSYEPSPTRIRDVLDISSAAPVYYPPVASVSEGVVGIDGGVCANNPVDMAYAEALQLYGKDAEIEILSVGTGMSFDDTKSFREARKTLKFGGIQWLRDGSLLDILMNGSQELIHTKTKQFSEALGHKYTRVNGHIMETTMDDVSEKNIKKLAKVGDEWFDRFGAEIVAMLDHGDQKTTTTTKNKA